MDSKGCFSVKSGYNLAVNLRNVSSASGFDSLRLKPLWKSIWKLNVPPRVKMTVWKFINDILPTSSNILKRGTSTNPFCLFCRKYVGGESLSHDVQGREAVESCSVVPAHLRLLKLNYDVSWVENRGIGRVSWVVRDSGRSPILVGCERVLENWAIKNLEALMVIRGLYALLTRFEGCSPLPPGDCGV